MKNNFIEYLHKYSSGGKSPSIHIKKKNEGKFTQSAKEHGMGVLEYAQSVLNNPNASALQKKRANFARNAKVWKHRDGSAIHTFTNPYQEEYSAESHEPTYDMGELAPVYVTAKATPEERNKAQLRANELWRQYYKDYAKWETAKNAAELAQQQREFNAYIRKGMDDFGRDYVFPAATAFLPIPKVAGLPFLTLAVKSPAARIALKIGTRAVKSAAKTAKPIVKKIIKPLSTFGEVSWNPSKYTRDFLSSMVKYPIKKIAGAERFEKVLANPVTLAVSKATKYAAKAADTGVHAHNYATAASVINDKLHGRLNWISDVDESGETYYWPLFGTALAALVTFPLTRGIKQISEVSKRLPIPYAKTPTPIPQSNYEIKTFGPAYGGDPVSQWIFGDDENE